MINFVTTHSHAYTVKHLTRQLGRNRCRRWTYEGLFRARSVSTGTWVFTDHERLSPFEMALAAEIANELEAAGARVLNHPGQVRGRYETLLALNDAGINDFRAWRCEDNPRPNAFPAFIRSASDHLAEDFTLLESQEVLEREIQRFQRSKIPLAGKLVVEYRGEEFAPHLWRRLSSYRVGDRIIAHHAAIGEHWVVKDGLGRDALERHPETNRFIACERRFVMENRFADILAKAFDLAGIEYGRADFALVDRRPQIYEINTNPAHGSRARIRRTTHADRLQTQLKSEEVLQAAILSLDQPTDGSVVLNGFMLRRQRRLSIRLSRALWRP